MFSLVMGLRFWNFWAGKGKLIARILAEMTRLLSKLHTY